MSNSGDNEYLFQPKDANGKPLVEAYIIRYRTEQELLEKLQSATSEVKFMLNRSKLTVADSGAPEPEDFSKEVSKFLEQTPDYFPCAANFRIVCLTAEQNNLSATAENLKSVYDTLIAQGMLIGRDGKPAKSSPTADRSGISYTDHRSGKVYHGREALEAMDVETYRKKMFSDPTFAAKADRVLAGR